MTPVDKTRQPSPQG